MKKTGSFGAIQDRLRQHIAATAATSKAASAKGAAIPTDQIIEKETEVTLPSSDPEVRNLLPSAGKPAEPKGDLTDTGVASGESMPGVTLSPPTEEKERKEVSPDTKLASINPEVAAIQNRLGETLKKAAEMLKAGGEVTSLGEKQENPDGSLGNNAAADASGATPTISGVSGVTQTDPGGSPSTPSSQGPGEKSPDAKLAAVSVKLGSDGSVKVTGVEGVETASPKIKTEEASIKQEGVKLAAADGSEIDSDALSEKIAMYSQDVLAGRAIAHQMVGFLQDMSRPEFQDRAKLAETVQNETMVSTIQALVDSGLEAGIISQKQAHDLMELAGFQPNPLYLAIANVQEKIAALDASSLTLEQKIAFVEKCANPEEAMAAAGGQPPVDPAQMQGAIGELLAQLEAAVASGQITEEQALQILQEQGVPVDQILGSAGGDPAAAGAAPDPTISADPSIAGDPAAIAPPTPAPAGAPEAPSAPAAPKSDDSPKKEEGGEKKDEGGEKKDDDGDKKRDDDKKEDKGEEKEASLVRSGLEQKLASFITNTRQKKAAILPSLAESSSVVQDPIIPVPEAPAPQMKIPAGMESAPIKIDPAASATAPASPGSKYPDVLGAGAAPPEAILANAMGGGGADPATPPAPQGALAKLTAALKDPTILTSLVAGGGLAAGGIAAHQMMKGDDEEEKRRKLKHAEIDPAMPPGFVPPPGSQPATNVSQGQGINLGPPTIGYKDPNKEFLSVGPNPAGKDTLEVIANGNFPGNLMRPLPPSSFGANPPNKFGQPPPPFRPNIKSGEVESAHDAFERIFSGKQAAGGDPAMAGGDPVMAGGDPAAAGAPPSIEEILAEIEAALQSGAITPEQAEEIIQILSAEMGGGGAPQPDPAAGAAPVM